MKYEIFETEEEKAAAVPALTGFADLPGWKLIRKAIDANISYFEDLLREKIESRRDFANLEQLYALQDRIDDLKNLRGLPADIMEAAQPEEPEEPEEPIYDTPATEEGA